MGLAAPDWLCHSVDGARLLNKWRLSPDELTLQLITRRTGNQIFERFDAE